MGEDISHVRALNKPLIRSEHDLKEDGRLLEMKGDPRFVIRHVNREFFTEFKIPIASMEEVAHINKGLFDELRNRYNILAPVSFFVSHARKGEDAMSPLSEGELKKGDESLCIATENIDSLVSKAALSFEHLSLASVHGVEGGIPVEKLEQFKIEYVSLFENLVKYFEDKFTTGERFLSDIAPDAFMEQYIYGRTASDTGEHLYLVDTDPFFHSDIRALRRVVSNLHRNIEREIGDGLPLEEVSERCNQLLKKITEKIRTNPPTDPMFDLLN